MLDFLKKNIDFSISKSEEDNEYWDFDLKPIILKNHTRQEILDVMNDLIYEIEEKIDEYDEDPNEDVKVDEMIEKGVFL